WALQEEGNYDPDFEWGEDDRPTAGTWGRGFDRGSDIIWEIFVPLKNSNKEHDGFQVERGDVFRACLQWEVQGGRSPDARGLFTEPHDSWTHPGDGYNPHECYDPSTWMRLQLA
ncbi:MAG TPA: hypothetical protein VHI93_00075, partial [Candidatus Thermoplasmatota archaeon]|nr:hypothetical protein [Candidatus Thermoplasmatota archaeon]